MRIPPQTVRQIHFIGIGGIGMSGIAEVLHNLGYIVSGSDISENSNIVRLRSLGIRVAVGHCEKNVAGAQVVVISSAIKADNIEVSYARSLRVPVVKRAEMLAELMRLKLSVAVSGTHGKTTTTSLVSSLFDAAGLDPTVVNGGIINSYNTNARLGKGEWIVVEADESDGSFVHLPATLAIVTNMDPEHMDHYGDFEAVKQAYVSFIENIPFYGLAILCVDDANVRSILPQVGDKRYITYGFDETANVRAVNLRPSDAGITFDVQITVNNAFFVCRSLGGDNVLAMPREISNIFLPMLGYHNVLNSLSMIAVAQELAVADDVIRQALGSFKGVKRRFTRVGESGGITVIDDYAHHPVEIRTVIESARQACMGRIIVIAQLHRYSRVKNLMQEFSRCFDGADIVVMAPIYSAGEESIPGITGESVAQGIKEGGMIQVHTISGPSELPYIVRHLARPGDMVLCLGAGNITQWAAMLPAQLDQLIREHTVNLEEKATS